MRPEQTAEYQEMIEDCQDRDRYCTDWELGFLETIEDQLADRGFLSEKQVSILNRIWEKCTERG